jgi:hypothetical protein
MRVNDVATVDRLVARDEADALEQLHRLGCTDGLPVVIPTPDRVERMVLATGYDADLLLGEMGPNLGACTIEKLAVAAVMAGCTPDHVPVVVAAARAVMDPTFDLTEVQATTHAIAPFIVVNGPVRHFSGLHGGFGAAGPGHRANASIGRALRLAMINIGGGRSGTADMALLGHPGKFTFCLAEDEEESPFPPLHTSRGMVAEQSAVTVLGTDAPHSVMGITDADDPGSTDRLLTSLAAAFASVATNNAVLGGGQAAVILNPDHAAALAAAGHTRESIAAAIAGRAVNTGAVLNAAASGRRRTAEVRYPCFTDADDVLVLVAGGGGLYSVALPSWCAGPHKNRAVTVEVEMDQACEIPGMRS